MRIQGRGGQLKAGGRPVAQVREWDAQDAPAGYTVQAQLSVVDAFYLEALPTFDVELMLGTRRFFWRRVPVNVAGDVASFGIDKMREER